MNCVVFTAVLAIVVCQALLKRRQVTETFRVRCGDAWASADSLPDIFFGFIRPLGLRCFASKEGNGNSGASGSASGDHHHSQHDLLEERE